MKLGQNIKILLLLWGHILLVPIVIILDLKFYADIIWISYAFIASAYFLYKRKEFKDHLLHPYLFAAAGFVFFGIILVIILFIGGYILGYSLVGIEMIKDWLR